MNIWDRFLFWVYQLQSKKLNAGYEYQAATPELTANRFKLLFNLHGIEVSEIPEVNGFENITLHDLNSNDRLLQKLTPELLHRTADTFGIKIEWLRSGEPTLYRHRHWYKEALKNFFEDLKDVDFEITYDPFIVITTHDKLDVDNPEYQPFVLVLRKHLGTVDEKDIYKYYMESVWHWHHPPCRLQAKALATQYYKLTKRIITMYKVNNDVFHKIVEGYIPPQGDLLMFNHKISFEEYAVAEFPNTRSYEQQECPAIIETSKDYEIDTISYEYIKKSEVGDEKTPPKRKPGRKKDNHKLEIKERFVQEYHQKIQLNQISRSQAAKDFYESLTPEEEKTLLRSAKEHDYLNDNQLEDNIVRTLKDYYREFEKSCS